MQDSDKTKDQLIDELNEMRRKVAELETAESRGQDIEKILKESEENTHLNLSSVISEGHPIETEELASVINIPQIQSLMDDFYKLTNIGSAILDLKGNILVATGWQDICTKFHRVHPDTLRSCVESDLHLTENVNEGEYLVYKCKNNMWDMVTPIVMGGKHVGNLYLGQFFFEDEVPDIVVFETQAQRYGFDKDEYLVALNKVPRWSREQVNTAMTFCSNFASMFGELSYSNLNLTKMVIKSKTVGDALRESEERFRNVFEQGPLGIAVVGLDYRWISVNATLCEMLGYTEDELTKLTFADITHPDDIEEDVGYAEKLKRGEIPSCKFEKRYIKKNGEVVWINLTATLIRDDHDEELYYLSMIEDITQPKQMQQELLQSEERHRSLVENSFDGIFIQKGFTITFANSRLYEMLGYSPGELEGMDPWLVYHPDYQDLIRRRAIPRMRGEQVISQYEVMLQKKDGSSLPVESSAQLVQVDGEPGIQIWLRDISERRRSEVAQRRLAIAVEQSVDAILITDKKGNIEYANKVTEQIADCGQAELIGKKAWTLDIRNEDETYRPRTWSDALKGEIATGAILLNRDNKEPAHLALTITPVRDASGQIMNYVAIYHDVTEQLESERKLLQSQKMEAIGTLAGGIAHDFNNILFAILGYTEMAQAEVSPDSKIFSNLQCVLDAGQRAGVMVKHILSFSRKIQPERKALFLGPIVKEGLKFLRSSIPTTIEIRENLETDLPTVWADPTQIHQVLMNLCTNAAQAMRDTTGVLSIDLSSEELDPEFAAQHPPIIPGKFIRLTVEDTGRGMEPKIINRVFEPFFTTKKQGEGTGLGLSVIHGIVQSHGGTITVYSELGKGTTFNVFLPVIEAKPKPEETGDVSVILAGNERILLVDDEEVLVDMVSAMLTEIGYEVTSKTSSRDALELFRLDPQRFDLVITDFTMPEMTGAELARELIAIRPEISVILCSGLSLTLDDGQIKEWGVRTLIRKPILKKDLARAVRGVLDQESKGAYHENRQ